MKNEDLYRVISGIDPEILEEAQSFSKSRPLRRRHWIAAAACLCVSLLLLHHVSSRDRRVSIPDPNDPAGSKQQQGPAPSTQSPEEDRVLLSAGSLSADLVKIYEDAAELSADAEVILSGKVCAVTPYLNSAGSICELITVVPDEVFKSLSPAGEIRPGDELTIHLLGGVIPAKQYYLERRDFLIDMMGDEDYEMALAACKENEFFCNDVMGVPFLWEGDDVLLFLTYREKQAWYSVTGTGVFGQFVKTGGSTYSRSSTDGLYNLTVSTDDIRTLAATVPDQSASIRSEKQP